MDRPAHDCTDPANWDHEHCQHVTTTTTTPATTTTTTTVADTTTTTTVAPTTVPPTTFPDETTTTAAVGETTLPPIPTLPCEAIAPEDRPVECQEVSAAETTTTTTLVLPSTGPEVAPGETAIAAVGFVTLGVVVVLAARFRRRGTVRIHRS